MTTELGLAALANALYAAVFLFVGRGVGDRFSAPWHPFAARAFVLWWYLMAAQAATAAVAAAAGWSGMASVGLHATLFTLTLLFASGQIWALGHYVLYVWGAETRRTRWPLIAFAAAYFVYFFLLLVLSGAGGVAVGTWAAGIDLGSVAPYLPVIATLLSLPIFVLLAAYYVLALRTDNPTKRTRVVALGTAASVWNLAQVAALAEQAGRSSAFHGFLVAANLGWAILLWLTHFPPPAVSRLFGLKGIDAESSPPGRTP